MFGDDRRFYENFRRLKKELLVKETIKSLQSLCEGVRRGRVQDLARIAGQLRWGLRNIKRTRLPTPLDVAEEEFVRALIKFIEVRAGKPRTVVIKVENVKE
jgi:hypothetical protein